ncbi:CD209 antigen-like protein E isoform X2 [Corythoichthys intestinalis]|uniref:CD209 antigen-like protein E isoform X2 n=1 Tax=Corythoichthys intestinalis TaxID=161448 RepID=UPI0025A5BCBE|nr:CD209 antigen-like protein E isoform X2 [Corythoichthys intestinalis]
MQNINTKKKQFKEETGANEAMLENNREENLYALAHTPHKKEKAAGSSHYARLQKPSEDMYSTVVKTEKDAAAGSSHYAGLQRPSEDIYSNIANTAKTAQSTVRPYKVACLILSVLCLVLLLVVIVLIVKIYPKNQASWIQETCDKDQCSALTPQDEHRFRCCYPCPRGWVRLDQSCFFFSTFNLSKPESESYCTRKGGHLAIIKSAKVQTFLSESGNGLRYWFGPHRSGNQWQWIDGTPLREDGYDTYWRHGYNTLRGDSSGYCAVLDSRLPTMDNWKDYNCWGKTYFICQIQM